MIDSGGPITRERWISLSWLGTPSKTRSAEEEAEAP
jgi:hypothetical protein